MSNKRKNPSGGTSAVDEISKKARPISPFFGSAPPPAATAGGAEPASNWDKDGWYNNLSDEAKDLLKLEYETLHISWLKELKDTVVSNGFLSLKRFLKGEKEAGKTVFPKEEDIYSWSRYCPFNTVKVVILGQDPYHGPNQAHGLSFSVRPPNRAPPSLVNMYKALENDYPDFKRPPNNNGLLSPWAEQGVLMLNTCLTVRRGEPNSHAKKGWEILTDKVVELVAEKRRRGVVFMAWGSFAQGRCKQVDTKKHLVLNSVHPSPLSANRLYAGVNFFNSGHFKKANDYLSIKYGAAGVIDWNLDRAPVSDAVSGPTASAPALSPPVAEKQVPLAAGKGKGVETVDDVIAAVAAGGGEAGADESDYDSDAVV